MSLFPVACWLVKHFHVLLTSDGKLQLKQISNFKKKNLLVFPLSPPHRTVLSFNNSYICLAIHSFYSLICLFVCWFQWAQEEYFFFCFFFLKIFKQLHKQKQQLFKVTTTTIIAMIARLHSRMSMNTYLLSSAS